MDDAGENAFIVHPSEDAFRFFRVPYARSGGSYSQTAGMGLWYTQLGRRTQVRSTQTTDAGTATKWRTYPSLKLAAAVSPSSRPNFPAIATPFYRTPSPFYHASRGPGYASPERAAGDVQSARAAPGAGRTDGDHDRRRGRQGAWQRHLRTASQRLLAARGGPGGQSAPREPDDQRPGRQLCPVHPARRRERLRPGRRRGSRSARRGDALGGRSGNGDRGRQSAQPDLRRGPRGDRYHRADDDPQRQRLRGWRDAGDFR